VCSTVYHPSGETALPCYLIKIAMRVLASSRIIELWFEAWWSSSRCLLDSFLFFRWLSSRYWKIYIRVDSLWKIGTKLIGSLAWSLSLCMIIAVIALLVNRSQSFASLHLYWVWSLLMHPTPKNQSYFKESTINSYAWHFKPFQVNFHVLPFKTFKILLILWHYF
jgi:hypothetical protein